MRRVKFRGKILKEKGLINAGEWIEGGYYRDDCYGGCPEGKHYIVQWNSGYGGFTDLIEVDGNTVGEWTGLRDKNGKWIYEGDIIKAIGYREFIELIEYRGTSFTAQGDSLSDFSNLCDGNVEIIGNIYENPELMEVIAC